MRARVIKIPTQVVGDPKNVVKPNYTREELLALKERLKGIRYDLERTGLRYRRGKMPGAGTHMEAQAMGVSTAIKILEEVGI